MSVTIRPARESDVEALARFWHLNMNDRLTRDQWRAVADCPWYGDPPNRGWLAVDEGRIVGAMALVHSVREIGGRSEQCCNIGSLYVLKDYRGRGLARAIARESTADESITYFGIDAAPQTRAVLEPPAVGFEILDARRYTWKRRGPDSASSIELLSGEQALAANWCEAERRVLAHHLPFGMKAAVARLDDRECRLVLWVRNKTSDALYHEVFHASDWACFAAMAGDIADAMLPDNHALLAADARFFRARPPHAEVETLRQPRHFKSRRLAPAEVDLLYSEVPLLGLKLS